MRADEEDLDLFNLGGSMLSLVRGGLGAEQKYVEMGKADFWIDLGLSLFFF